MAPNVRDPNSLRHKVRKAGPEAGKKGSLPVVTLVQRTDALLRGLVLVMEHHDAPPHILRKLEEQIHSYLDSSKTEAVWLKRCKHLLAYPLAKYLKNEPPPEPDMSFKPSGKLREWLKPRLNSFNPENTHFWYSWYQSKRSTLPVSDQLVKSAYNQHFQTLTSPDPGDEETIDKIFSDPTFMKVLKDVRKGLNENLSRGEDFVDLFPKSSASFGHQRVTGGQSSDLRWMCGLSLHRINCAVKYPDEVFKWDDYIMSPKTCDFVAELWIQYPPALDDGTGLLKLRGDEKKLALTYLALTVPSEVEMIDMVYRPWVYTRHGILSNFHATRYCAYGQYEWRTLSAYTSYATTLPSVLNCTIQAVLEPNKIRIISKGEALPYYSCKPLQKALHTTMRNMPSFRLIGRPLDLEDIRDLTNMTTLDMKWFSVDYSAATDGLSWKYSGRIFRYLIEDLPEMQREIANLVLGPHQLWYPGEDMPRGIQTNGQLMGSILSFPILCLANLGVYLLTTQQEHRFWSHDQRLNHVLINGDDMVYASDPDNWVKHVDIGKKVGLEMSVGKAYVHREYLNINSTSIHCPLHKKVVRPTIREIGFLNSGLFFGQHKVQGRRNDGMAASHHEAAEGIVVNINEMLKGSLPKKQIDFLKKIMTTHKTTIADECRFETTESIKDKSKFFSRNLFIPESLGGMGVKAPEGFKFRITKEEVYVAQGFLDKYPGCGYTTQRPLPGYEVTEKFDSYVSKPWECKDLPDNPWDYLEKEKSKKKSLLPIKRVFHRETKTLCRTGFIRYAPYEGCLLTSEESGKLVPQGYHSLVVPVSAETPHRMGSDYL